MEIVRFAIALILATLAAIGAAFLAMLLFGATFPGGLFGYVYGITDTEAALAVGVSVVTVTASMWVMVGWIERYEDRKWTAWRDEA